MTEDPPQLDANDIEKNTEQPNEQSTELTDLSAVKSNFPIPIEQGRVSYNGEEMLVEPNNFNPSTGKLAARIHFL